MSREAERNKLIARLVVERKTDDEIKQAVADFDAKNPQGIQKAIGQFVNFHINNGKRALGLMGAPAAGLAKATETGNPLDFLTGTAGAAKDAIFDPDKEQKEMADVLNMPNNTWTDTAKRFGVNTLTDPTTYMGAGLLKSGLKGFGKQALKGTAIAGAAAASAKQKPDEFGNAALPFAAVGALSPDQWKKVPDGYFSQLEREISALGKKPISTLHIGKKLTSRMMAPDGIKPDEWRDVGMDEILASRQEWTPQQLLEEVQKRRPSIGFDVGSQWKDFSTARAQKAHGQPLTDWLKNGPPKHNYKATQLRQKGLEFAQKHWGNDTVAHLRTDISTSGTPTGQRKDLLINEMQSDLHQNATKKAFVDETTLREGENVNDGQQLLGHEDYLKLTPEQLKQRLGYRSRADSQKLDRFRDMMVNSMFEPSNVPLRSRSRVNAHHKQVRKLQKYHSRFAEAEGDETVKVSPPRIVTRLSPNSTNQPFWKSEEELKQALARHEIPLEYDPRFSSSSIADGKNYDNANIGANRRARTVEEAMEARTGDPYTLDSLFQQFENGTLGKTADATPHAKVQQKMNAIAGASPEEAAFRKSWLLLMAKQAIKEAVESGADRIGVLDGEGVGRILQDVNGKARRDDLYNREIPGVIESFLRSQGIDAKFGEPELFSHSPTAPIREQYLGRFTNVTPQIRELVKKGMPLYLAVMMFNMNKEKDEQAR